MQSETRGPSRKRFQVAVRQGGVRKRWEFGSAEEAAEAREKVQELKAAGVELTAPSEVPVGSRPDPYLWFDPTRRWSPSERLYLQMIERAREDLGSSRARLRREARDWILSDDRHPCSFVVCCEVIDRGIEETRQRLLKGDTGWSREPSRPLTLVRKDSQQN